MADPLPFYQQILAINGQILSALADPADLDHVIALLEERAQWMRPANQPAPEAEQVDRAAILPLMETIIAQDTTIASALEARQADIAELVQAGQRARIAREYGPGREAPDAKFLDRAG